MTNQSWFKTRLIGLVLETYLAFSVPTWMCLYEKQTLFLPLYVWDVCVCVGVCVVCRCTYSTTLSVITYLSPYWRLDLSVVCHWIYQLAVSKASKDHPISTSCLAVRGCDYRHNHYMPVFCGLWGFTLRPSWLFQWVLYQPSHFPNSSFCSLQTL